MFEKHHVHLYTRADHCWDLMVIDSACIARRLWLLKKHAREDQAALLNMSIGPKGMHFVPARDT